MIPESSPRDPFAAMWARLRALESEVRFLRSSQDTLSRGGVGRGDLEVDGTARIRVRQPGDFILEDEDGSVIWRSSVDPIRTATCYDADNSLSLAAGWTQYGETPALTSNVPSGFLYGDFSMIVAADDAFSSVGNVSVQPTAKFIWGDGSTPTTYYGDVVTSGNDDVASVTCPWAKDFTIGTDPALSGTQIAFGLRATRAGGEVSGTSGKWRVMSQLIYRRGA